MKRTKFPFPDQESFPDDIAHIKILPHSIEAEQSVLGGLLIDGSIWDSISEKIGENDFYRHEHRIIFHTMKTLSQQENPIDILTVSEVIKKNQQLEEIGGEVYLFELANNTASTTNIQAYANIIRERSIVRQLIQVSQDVSQNAFFPENRSGKEILDDAERRVFEIAQQNTQRGGPQHINEHIAKAMERIDILYESDTPVTGMSTGYSDLDRMTSGLQPADLVIIAGRPSMGKTAFSMNIAEHVAIKSDKVVLIFSMEMPGEALVMRLISSLGRIDQHRLRSGNLTEEDWPRITSAVSILSRAKLSIDDTAALTPTEMRARAKRIAREHGEIGLIVIDYLQLMRVSGKTENRTAEISEISRSLKGLAKELNAPVIALSQLNRSLEQRTDKRPMMSDLRESGAIEQDADLIAFIYRDEVYNEASPDKGSAEIIIAKQRNGPIGKVRLTFLGQYTRFENFVTG